MGIENVLWKEKQVGFSCLACFLFKFPSDEAAPVPTHFKLFIIMIFFKENDTVQRYEMWSSVSYISNYYFVLPVTCCHNIVKGMK